MALSIVGALAVIVLAQISTTNAQGACPTLFNFYGHPTDCTKFYRCFWGSPVEFHCPAGTNWNQQILTCDYAYKVPCVRAVLDPIYKLVKNDGYGYVSQQYGNGGWKQGTQGYVKGSYTGYTTGTRYGGGYVRGNGYYGNTYAPRVSNNFARFQTRNPFYQNGGYARDVYGRYPAYGGYIASGYATSGTGSGGFVRRATPSVRSPSVQRVFNKTWKK